MDIWINVMRAIIGLTHVLTVQLKPDGLLQFKQILRDLRSADNFHHGQTPNEYEC